jgi:hypothetical protein
MYKHNESLITTFGCGGKSSLISESLIEIQINIHLVRVKPNNMTYARSLGPYVRLTFAKSLQGQNCSSTLGMKSWFHSNRPTIAVVLGFLILPPTTTIEWRLRFDQAVTEATRS